MMPSQLFLEALERADPNASQGATERNRDCCRCSSLAGEIRKSKPDWTPRTVVQWVQSGIVYFGGLCSQCARIEREQRRQLRQQGRAA